MRLKGRPIDTAGRLGEQFPQHLVVGDGGEERGARAQLLGHLAREGHLEADREAEALALPGQELELPGGGEVAGVARQGLDEGEEPAERNVLAEGDEVILSDMSRWDDVDRVRIE